MTPKVGTLAIEGYRALRHLRLEGLGRVNLITGRNNTGKSSVLESLHILASDTSPSVIWSILRDREEAVFESEQSAPVVEGDDFRAISSLFSDFPSPGLPERPLRISVNGTNHPQVVSLSIGHYREQRESDGTLRLVPQEADVFLGASSLVALVIDTEDGRRIQPLDTFRRPWLRTYRGEWLQKPRWPSVFVGPCGSERTGALGPMWDRIALSDREDEVVDALRIIAPDIVGIAMIGGDGPRTSRTAIAVSSNTPRPVPLRSFGGGVTRLFSIVLSLVNAQDGLLLIDEIENGMHHTVQLDLWRVIFRLARRLHVQVFATSHSWDSVEAFQKAASEDPEDGVLIRLARKGENIIPTLLHEDELAIATRDHIEVR